MTTQPFQINIPSSRLESLQTKLAAASLPSAVDFSDDVNYGASLADIKRLVARWRDGFNWRAQEAKLNQIPQFTTEVDVEGFGEIKMHFVHQRSQRAGAVPLLFCHGCK